MGTKNDNDGLCWPKNGIRPAADRGQTRLGNSAEIQPSMDQFGTILSNLNICATRMYACHRDPRSPRHSAVTASPCPSVQNRYKTPWYIRFSPLLQQSWIEAKERQSGDTGSGDLDTVRRVNILYALGPIGLTDRVHISRTRGFVEASLAARPSGDNAGPCPNPLAWHIPPTTRPARHSGTCSTTRELDERGRARRAFSFVS
jgi:hypothetical protein